MQTTLGYWQAAPGGTQDNDWVVIDAGAVVMVQGIIFQPPAVASTGTATGPLSAARYSMHTRKTVDAAWVVQGVFEGSEDAMTACRRDSISAVQCAELRNGQRVGNNYVEIKGLGSKATFRFVCNSVSFCCTSLNLSFRQPVFSKCCWALDGNGRCCFVCAVSVRFAEYVAPVVW